MIQTVATGTTVDEAVSNALAKLGLTRDQVKIEIIDEGKKGFLGFGAREAKVRVTAEVAGTEPETASEAAKVEPAEVTAAEPAEPLEPLDSGGTASPDGTVQPENPAEADPVPFEKEQGEEKGPVVPVEPLEPVFPEGDEEEPERDLDEAIALTADYLKSVVREMGAEDAQVFHLLDGKNLEFRLESGKAAMLIGKRGQTLNALQQLVQVVANNYAKQFLIVSVDVGDYRAKRAETLKVLADRKADQAVRTGARVALEPMPASERKIIHHELSERFDVDTHSEGREPHRHIVIEPHK
ncbi:RNA-binding cell elongation regulator Jag/EloR [Bhargavaea beijingensis]|uniref:RNA-binding protein KhpB n=1 Tax=Bhargavaea beijingensis TaxID=426756 RepID=A0A1G7ETG6_9BACL|nr:RNA-binding cell elongation regulator Jag/EloR [Bhargavaea beijingensis]MCW1929062.1 Jag N-terminal domain-containing protein [Bhargavaea beijingensis]RSK34443.1 protein jag [Bhargavaea beijingensis]SDE66776.1 spoIIIJ-associated protein [Bhargavaea beijingensis]